MSTTSLHERWLSLIEISGPFLAVPILKETFPQGLEELESIKRKRLRQAYEEWREALDADDTQFNELHVAWIDEVLSRGLEFDEDGKGDVLKSADWCAANLQTSLIEHSVTIAPDFAVIDEQRANKVLLLIQVYTQETDLNTILKKDGWAASPADRMVQLCRSLNCRLGLVTNGEHWMLVDAPTGAITTFASWYSRIWSQEPITLQAFVHLLGIRRFFVDESEQLPALFDRSLKFQDEVTDALGEQVRRAIEVLIQALDKADQDRNRELLQDVKEPELYEAALTVMMRLVFLLSAEERGLILMGDECYEAYYALSTLRMQLRKKSEEILERRWDAWSRLLALFRAVYGGIEHENLRLPALGGSLFDPDRFPFLEGRSKGSSWRSNIAKPLPIDNRTVLLLLEAIQQFQGRTLSYRALDVEQIGYVYEGLLERTVRRTDEVTLELDATKSAKTPWVTLAELDSVSLDSVRLVELLKERSGCSISRVQRDLVRPVDDILIDRLLTACQGDSKLRDRVKPYVHLLRTDPWGYPLVYPAGSFIVTTGSGRRETGTHYTPKSLTEAIVAETLTPVTYIGPAEGVLRDQWALKSPSEILDLKICDPAMGSGAFLVQVCRWLSDRLVEAWSKAEALGKVISIDGDVLEEGSVKELLPEDSEARTVIARRLIAERCLYGVDLNPLAVELAKLSIWLVTLAKGRPFGFLDHNLRCGDSLLGIHCLDQLIELPMKLNGRGQQRLFGGSIENSITKVIKLRHSLREMPKLDIHDIETIARLNKNTQSYLEVSERIADTYIGELFATQGNDAVLETKLTSLTIQAVQAIEGNYDAISSMYKRSVITLSTDLASDKPLRRPFHWPLEFPEVFAHERDGFDCIVGNPPFLGGQRITGVAGTAYRDWLVEHIAEGRRGSADLVAYFFLRSWSLLREGGSFGLLAVNTVAEGDTRQVGLEPMVAAGATIYMAYPNEPWPGKAAVITSRIHVYKGKWVGERLLLGRPVPFISAFLSNQEEWSPARLKANEGLAYQGSIVLGMGFILSPDEAYRMLNADPRNADVIFPYLNGEDLNSDPEQKPKRWAINFWDWPEEKAKTYTLPYKWLEDHVKAERLANKDKGAREKWWLFLRARSELYHAIGYGHYFENHPRDWSQNQNHAHRVLAITRVSKTLAFSFVDSNIIFSDATVAFSLNRGRDFALLQSNIHAVFAWQYASRLKNDLRYSQTDALEPFAFPKDFNNTSNGILDNLGEQFHLARCEFMRTNNIGLTKFYKCFHADTELNPCIDRLRALQCEMDKNIAQAYGWDDFDLQHGFHEVPYLPENDRVRFTISETARVEVLKRLSDLNRQRYKDEVAGGLHKKSKKNYVVKTEKRQVVSVKKDSKLKISPEKSTAVHYQEGFDFSFLEVGQEKPISTPSIDNQSVDKPSDQILVWLEDHVGWYPKVSILNGCKVSETNWKAAIAELIHEEFVEAKDTAGELLYRFKG